MKTQVPANNPDRAEQHHQIINFNTSFGTKNIGDYIIVDSVFREMDFLFKDKFVLNLPTHTPVALPRQTISISPLSKSCNTNVLKFIDGTNIIKKSLFRPWPDWNISFFTKKPYKNAILIGAGLGGSFTKVGPYTKYMYKTILSKKYIHSTRDEQTKKFLESLGLRAINTGCATMWGLTKEHCKKIKETKSDKVVFTITDYDKNPELDSKMIEILRCNYKKIFFFAQGIGDLDYLNTISKNKDIETIYNLEQYKQLLESSNIDYIGTRLHAGLYALQKYARTIIVIIDNRARDINADYDLPSIERNNIAELEQMINNNIKPEIKINTENINAWKKQFIKYASKKNSNE